MFALSGDRSSTLSAQYTFTGGADPIPSPVSTNSNGGTNLPPGILTSQVFLFTNGNSAASAFSRDAGKNLWVVRVDGTLLNQISGFTDPVSGFPHGALYSPFGDALVGAGTIFGTNGLWIIPLSADGTDCEGMPIRLPTSPGDPIDFAGSIIAAPEPPLLRVRLDGDTAVVFWPANAEDFILEMSPSVSPAFWTPVPGPYAVAGQFFELRYLRAARLPAQFFRLRWP